MFSEIRHTIGEKLLLKKAAKVQRNKQVRNLSTCHSAGIIFDATNSDDFNVVKEFMKYLTSLKIKSNVLGFVNADSVHSNLLLWDNCHFFCKKEIDLFYRPKTEVSKVFLSKKYDILFDLSLKDVFTLRYLTTLCNADFKVGSYSEGVNDLDLMIDIRKEPLIGYLKDQIINYVTILNNPAAISHQT